MQLIKPTPFTTLFLPLPQTLFKPLPLCKVEFQCIVDSHQLLTSAKSWMMTSFTQRQSFPHFSLHPVSLLHHSAIS